MTSRPDITSGMHAGSAVSHRLRISASSPEKIDVEMSGFGSLMTKYGSEKDEEQYGSPRGGPVRSIVAKWGPGVAFRPGEEKGEAIWDEAPAHISNSPARRKFSSPR